MKIVSQINRDGDVYYIEIPAEELEDQGLRDGDIVRTEFSRAIPPPPQDENRPVLVETTEEVRTEPEG